MVLLHGIGRFIGFNKTYQIPNAERSSQYLSYCHAINALYCIYWCLFFPLVLHSRIREYLENHSFKS